MGLQGQCCSEALSLSSLCTLSTRRLGPYRGDTTSLSMSYSKARRFQVMAFAVKRSPKRLKYATPRFTKEDELLYVEVDPSGADSWKLEPVVDLLKQGAVGVIPTDTVYALVCDLRNNSAIERLRRIKNIEPLKPLSILCHSFRDIDTYTNGFPRGDGQGHANMFRSVKQCLPGPYTFILTASKGLPKQCIRYGTTTAKYASRKNVGVRMPDDAICQAILEKMYAPLISTRSYQWRFQRWFAAPTSSAGCRTAVVCRQSPRKSRPNPNPNPPPPSTISTWPRWFSCSRRPPRSSCSAITAVKLVGSKPYDPFVLTPCKSVLIPPNLQICNFRSYTTTTTSVAVVELHGGLVLR